MLTTTADHVKDQDKNKNIKIYFDGSEVGFMTVKYIENDVHECDEEDCPMGEGEVRQEGCHLSTDYLIEAVLNRPASDPEGERWPQYQNIKTISFEFKNSFLYYNTYDYEYMPFQDNQKPPTATHMIPVSNIEGIDIHRESSYKERFYQLQAKSLKPDRKTLRKHIQR
jgi:hypothetical protein